VIWWGHIRQGEVSEEIGTRMFEPIKAGKLSLIALHASHWSVPFMAAMNEVTREEARRQYPGPNVKFEFVPPPGSQLRFDGDGGVLRIPRVARRALSCWIRPRRGL
jgi:hypothetical protein